MNRTDHLLRSVRDASKLNFHEEHIIIDFGSSHPIALSDLPDDNRIKLHRIDSTNGKWWLTHSFNLGFSLAQSEYILKLDADVLLTPAFSKAMIAQLNESNAHLLCNRLTNQDWGLPNNLFTTNGLFLCKRSSLEALSGFNPYIRGWGWDEIDLYSRFFLAGFPISKLPRIGIELIEHGDAQRETPIENRKFINWYILKASKAKEPRSRMRANNEKNRRIAIASIVKNISWPSLDEYKRSFLQTGALPDLQSVGLFDQNEYEQLLSILARRLLDPSNPTEVIYRMLRRFGVGPYKSSNAEQLLKTCGIDLSLVV